MAIQDLKAQIARLPEQPGVYLYFNQAGETVYVGKARALRDRVRSYLGAWGVNPKTDALLDEVMRLEVIVTDSVVEALALENNLIKQRNPKYNILLRDDKNYPYLQLTTGERFPRVLVARRVEPRDGHVYAGPFLPARLARRTMALTHRLFGIRSCNEVITGRRGRPCLEYDINRCIAPCVDTICSEAEYRRAVEDTKLFLEGRTEELVADLQARMGAAASAERFEQAGQLRDAMRTVQTLVDRHQKMAAPDLSARDVFGVKLGPAGAVVQVFQVRGGRVVDRVELATGVSDLPPGSEAELVAAAIGQFYADSAAPPEIHVPSAPDERETIEAWLTREAGRRIRIVVPRRGEKRGLLDLAARNAALAYDARFNAETVAHYGALETLQAVLGLPALPRRIECFDISTIQGSETVASMVVCEDGRLKKGEYRKFKVTGEDPRGANRTGTDGAGRTARFLDDFAAMRQVVQRRYARVSEQGGPFPDLIVIDGGKGQLSAAYEALESLGLANLVAVGLAKKEELIFTRDHPDPLVLAADCCSASATRLTASP
jgi:excinuclease ABC subunit C